jgi:hypothetical protein
MKRILPLVILLLPLWVLAQAPQTEVDCGEMYVVTPVPDEGFHFVRWSDDYPYEERIVTANEDLSFTAIFEADVPEEDNTLVIKDREQTTLDDGSTLPNVIVVEPGGQLNLATTNINLDTLIITTDGNHSGQVNLGNGTVNAAHVFMDFILEPGAETASPNKWYAFAVPFNVAMNGISRTCDNKSLVSGTDFLIMRYDSEQRAQTGKGWVKNITEPLNPGSFYMLGIDGTCNHWRFEKSGIAFEGNDHLDLQPYGVDQFGETPNTGWNSLGNTQLTYSSLDLSNLLQDYYIYVYDNQLSKYILIDDPATLELYVGRPFFIQVKENATIVLNNSTPSNMPALRARRNDTPKMHFTLTNASKERDTDHMYLTLHKDATETYTIGRDVARMGTDCRTAAQLWCNMTDGTQLAAHGISMPETETVINLNMFAPVKGAYRLNLSNRAMDEYEVALMVQGVYTATLYDNQPIVLDLNKGTTSDYSIRIRRKAPTDITTIQSDKSQNSKVLIDGHMYIFQGGHVYDAQGKAIK